MLLLGFCFSSIAQVTARRAVRPLEKQGLIPPSSPAPQPRPAAAPAPTPTAGQRPALIEPDLKPSPINLFGKIDGLSGTLYVTNIGKASIAPFVQLAVVDKNGRMVGWVTNSGPQLQPKESEKIQVLATNLNAVDFKIMRLVGRK
jgi:hypothetical protein